MKIRSTIAVIVACFITGATLAAEMEGTKMDKPAGSTVEKAQTHHAVGVVQLVDAAKGTITLSHEAVPSLKWPAMTMAFKASKDQIASVKPGDRVNFEFVAKGMDATITTLTKVK